MAKVSLDAVADELLTGDDPVRTAPEVADALDCSRRHAADRLDLLARNDDVGTKKVGGRARVYWHVDRVCPPHVAPEDHPAQSDLADAARPADAPERDVGRETTEDADDGLDADLDALDLPGGGALLDVRRENVRACYELLRREGTASRSDFIEQVYRSDDYDRAGYETEGGWWNTIGKKGLRGLAERRDDFEAPGGEGAHQWRYVGDG